MFLKRTYHSEASKIKVGKASPTFPNFPSDQSGIFVYLTPYCVCYVQEDFLFLNIAILVGMRCFLCQFLSLLQIDLR